MRGSWANHLRVSLPPGAKPSFSAHLRRNRLARRHLPEGAARRYCSAKMRRLRRYPPTSFLRKRGRRSGAPETDARGLYTGAGSFYRWYYQTYSLRMMGGIRWKNYGPAIEKTLLATQETAGHALGSWDPVLGWSRQAGRIYATAMATLTLEVYYRSKAGLSIAASKKADEKKLRVQDAR